MEFTLKVQLEASPALTECINALASALTTQRTIDALPTKENNPTNVEKKTDVEDKSTKTEKNVMDESTKAEEQKSITDEELRAIVGPKTKEVGKDKVFAILEEFGVKRVPDLTQEQRVDFIEKLRSL